MTQHPHAAPLRLVLFSDDRALGRTLMRALAPRVPDVSLAQIDEPNPPEAALDPGAHDIAFVDGDSHQLDPTRIALALKQRAPERPVVWLASRKSLTHAVEAVMAGLDDYVLDDPLDLERLPAIVIRLGREVQAGERDFERRGAQVRALAKLEQQLRVARANLARAAQEVGTQVPVAQPLGRVVEATEVALELVSELRRAPSGSDTQLTA